MPKSVILTKICSRIIKKGWRLEKSSPNTPYTLLIDYSLSLPFVLVNGMHMRAKCFFFFFIIFLRKVSWKISFSQNKKTRKKFGIISDLISCLLEFCIHFFQNGNRRFFGSKIINLLYQNLVDFLKFFFFQKLCCNDKVR